MTRLCNGTWLNDAKFPPIAKPDSDDDDGCTAKRREVLKRVSLCLWIDSVVLLKVQSIIITLVYTDYNEQNSTNIDITTITMPAKCSSM